MTENSWPEDIVRESGCRMPIANRDGLDDENKQRYDRVAAKLDGAIAGLRGPTGISFHSPIASGHSHALNKYLRFESEIPANIRETAILTVAREMDCSFEWAAHEPEALTEGVPAEIINLIKYRGPTDGIPIEYAAIIDLGREVLSSHKVQPETFARLVGQHDTGTVMDLILLVGNYTALAVLLLAVDQQLPSGDQAELPILPLS